MEGENNELAKSVAQEIQRKIDNEDNGESERLILILLMSIYTDVKAIKRNPAIEFGRFYRTHPKMTWISIVVGWVLAGVTAAGALYSVLDKFGLRLMMTP